MKVKSEENGSGATNDSEQPVSGTHRAAEQAGTQGGVGMSADAHRDHDTKYLAHEVCDALGVNMINGVTGADHIMEHAIGQACAELGVVEHAVRAYASSDKEDLASLYGLVRGIRARLSLVQEGASVLERILNDKPWGIDNG